MEDDDAGQPSNEGFDPGLCAARWILDELADKWALYVIVLLGHGEARFSEIRRRVDGISQRMLTVTLRALERDGVVWRTVHCPMPVHITYRLTPLGESLHEAVAPLVGWVVAHKDEIEAARAAASTSSL